MRGTRDARGALSRWLVGEAQLRGPLADRPELDHRLRAAELAAAGWGHDPKLFLDPVTGKPDLPRF